MSKYDNLKYWAKIKARKTHHCHECGTVINKAEYYFKENIDFVNTPQGFVLKVLCLNCGKRKLLN